MNRAKSRWVYCAANVNANIVSVTVFLSDSSALKKGNFSHFPRWRATPCNFLDPMGYVKQKRFPKLIMRRLCASKNTFLRHPLLLQSVACKVT